MDNPLHHPKIKPDVKVWLGVPSFTSLALLNISELYKFNRVQISTSSIQTFVARERLSKRRVVIKHLNLSKDTDSSEVIRFIREMQCLQRLDHANILNTHKYARTLEGPFVVLEHFDGSALGRLVKKEGLDAVDAIAITIKVCEAIEYCHRQGIVHRNINPNSILVDKNGHVKLTDFSFAVDAESKTLPIVFDELKGAEDYIAPEGMQRIDALNHLSDLWSLAAILHFLLSGKSPRILRLDSFSNGLSALLGQMLSEDPADRLQTAKEFNTQLRQIESLLNGTTEASIRNGNLSVPGQCQGCGHINNQARTFCGECGFSLHCECVSCGATIRVWDKTCVHCTASQEKAAHHDNKSPINTRPRKGEGISSNPIRPILHRSGSLNRFGFSRFSGAAQTVWSTCIDGAAYLRNKTTESSLQDRVTYLSQVIGTGFEWCRRQINGIAKATVWLSTTAYVKMSRLFQHDDNTVDGPASLGIEDTFNPSLENTDTSSIGGVTYTPDHNKPIGSPSNNQPERKEIAELFDSVMEDSGDSLAVEKHSNHASNLPYIDLSSRYEIEGELGKGGMGAVLLARDNSLGRHVAIKRIHRSLVQSKKAIDRFVIEARSIAALSFENIVQIYEFGRDEEGPFVVLEYVSGGTLLERISKGKLETEVAVDIICHLCNALSVAHGNGIIHRDIKPANILLTKKGIPKVTDFGLAQQQKTGNSHTAVAEIVGTIEFMSPEQRSASSNVDERSDLWSLAATCYQMVTGKSPKVIREREIPANLRNVLLKALEDRPQDRYQTAHELKLAFQSAVARVAILSQGDLEEGICASCNAVNDITRKFCRNCRESLIECCLSCGLECPVWEDVCGECGTSRSETKSALLVKYQNDIATAEQALAMYRFDRASECLEAVLACDYAFTVALVDVANRLSEKIAYEQATQFRLQDELLDLALEQLVTFDYAAAECTLSDFPIELRSQEFANLLSETIQKKEKTQQLHRDIQACLKARVVDGLLETTEQYLLLKPDDQRVRMLFDRLLDKSEKDSAIQQSNYIVALDYYRKFDDRRCIDTLILYGEDNQLTDEQKRLLDGATKRSSTSELLKSNIDRLGKMGQSSIAILQEYLALRPNDQSSQLVLDSLLLQSNKKAAQRNKQISNVLAIVILIITTGVLIYLGIEYGD